MKYSCSSLIKENFILIIFVDHSFFYTNIENTHIEEYTVYDLQENTAGNKLLLCILI